MLQIKGPHSIFPPSQAKPKAKIFQTEILISTASCDNLLTSLNISFPSHSLISFTFSLACYSSIKQCWHIWTRDNRENLGFLCFSGYDVPVAAGVGLPSFTPCGSQRPEASEYSGHQWRTDQTGRLWPGTHIQFSDGAYISGESTWHFLALFSWLLYTPLP